MIKKLSCITCKHNPQGICELKNKEIPMMFTAFNKKGHPKWCPKI